jgi:predicted nucleic acid-binding protein
MSKTFLDTNILVYAMDRGEPIKREICRGLLTSMGRGHRIVISTQVMQEFFVAATRKLNADPLIVKDILHSYERFEVVLISPERIKEAIDCSLIHRISFWDALIVSAAEAARCERILTEDMQHGQVIRGVRAENPFHHVG